MSVQLNISKLADIWCSDHVVQRECGENLHDDFTILFFRHSQIKLVTHHWTQRNKNTHLGIHSIWNVGE